jgi:alkanesulfonate monooxygenase SsuD/methylene tetrahydromethanopterin reductase-like flavin-dependent oxidoreductase (luciferase family)
VTATPDVGLLLGSEVPPERTLRLAGAAEDIGLASVWLAEDYFCAGGFSSAAAVLTATRRIEVGIGVTSVLVRHPAVTAMEIATIDRMFPGRLVAGLGHGAPAWMAQMGLTPAAAVREVRQRTQVIRSLLDGERVDHPGPTFAMDAVQLSFPPAIRPPLALGVSGPKMLAMAVEEADQVVLSVLSGPSYVSWVGDLAARAAAPTTRPPTGLVCFALSAVHEDGDLARRVARRSVARIICRRPDSPILRRAEHFAVIESMAARGVDFVEANLPEECLDELAVAGTPEHCADLVHRLGEAGAESVVLLPLMTGSDDELGGLRQLLAARDGLRHAVVS